MTAAGLDQSAAGGPEAHGSAVDEAPGFGRPLAVWMALVVVIEAALWIAGFRAVALSTAVDQGAAQVESRVIGEVSDDLIRKAIRTQRDTLPFWTVLTFLGDFLGEPAALATRALAAATLFSAAAALRGKPVGYDHALAACAAAQGVWVLGLAVRAGLMMSLHRPAEAVETSAALFLPAGVYPSYVWLAVRQLDLFSLAGWGLMARGAVRRGQVGWFGALAVVLILGLTEAGVRTAVGTMAGAGMRLSVMPR